MSPTDGANLAEWLLKHEGQLTASLLAYLSMCRWVGGKARTLQSASITEIFPLEITGCEAAVVIVQVEFSAGETELYVLPVASATALEVAAEERLARATIISSDATGNDKYLIDAFALSAFCLGILATIGMARRLRGSRGGELIGSLPECGENWEAWQERDLKPHVSTAEQSNTSVRFGSSLMLKLIRRLDPGRNPELEFGQFFTRQSQFQAYAPYHGAIEYRTPQGLTYTLSILQGLVPNQGDAWQYTLGEIALYFSRVPLQATPPAITGSLFDAAKQPASAAMQVWLGAFLPAMELLGRHTGEMHLALSTDTKDVDFAPEPFTLEYQSTLFANMQSFHKKILTLLERRLLSLSMQWQPYGERLLAAREALSHRLEMLQHVPLQAEKIRCHGDYHLGQVLYTGNDFVIIDFEGPPMLSIAERRLKRSALCDVAGMVRSFHYAALSGAAAAGQQAQNPLVSEWANAWYHAISAAFLRAYLDITCEARFLPPTADMLRRTFELYLLDKAIYELGYELNHRPDWVGVPLRGILDILHSSADSTY